jgi:L-malate glycosyltransferase
LAAEPYILFIASWYPNEKDPTLGIFIKRHAEAVSQYRRVRVLSFHQGDRFRIHRSGNNQLEEIRVEYRNSYPKLSLFSAFRKCSEMLFTEDKPSLIHAHVTMPAGFLAKQLSAKIKVPYVITEHWTGYNKQDGSYKGVFMKLMTSAAIKGASYILPVSKELEDSMRSHGLKANYKVIRNVADPLFYKTEIRPSAKKFIHISSLDQRQKNVLGILDVFSELQEKDKEVQLVIAGDGSDRPLVEKRAHELQLRNVRFTGNLDAAALSRELTDCTALVLFSNYENLPCVIIESFAAGVPVISTNVGGIAEIVDERNGILIQPNDKEALLKAMERMLLDNFDRPAVREYARQFSYEQVGKHLSEVYSSLE